MTQKFKKLKLKTDRIVMRPHQKGDEILLNKAVQNSFSELHKWMDWAEKPQTMEETIAFIEFTEKCWMEEFPNDLPMLIFDKEEKRILGSSGYHTINWKIPMLEIGYWVNAEEAGKGYITEAANVLTQYAFSNLSVKRVEIICDSENIKSSAIPKRLGFELEADFKNNRIQTGSNRLSGTLVFVRYNTIGMPLVDYEIESNISTGVSSGKL